ncbi:CBS domain-containing protein [Alteribacter natronophilus]|uniref:CBS domain-containing protein n=1 Tax=Alteribacter natronophilus TaxID=2583810 RepID=UPI00110D33A7|nr:CBS domain-containing protein [Alteribacter natronophilus]TMW70388.1 magnesium transporter [Alteribacter natronophilus]
MKLDIRNREEYTYYLMQAIKQEDRVSFRRDFLALHPIDQMDFYVECSEEKRRLIHSFLTYRELGELFIELDDQQQKSVLRELDEEDMIAVLRHLPTDELVDFLKHIPDAVSRYYIKKLDFRKQKQIRQLIGRQEHETGSFMTTECIVLSPDMRTKDALLKVKEQAGMVETLHYQYVVNELGSLIGICSLRELFLAGENEKISSLMRTQVHSIKKHTPLKRVLDLMSNYGLSAIPVTGESDVLEGIVTFDDVLEHYNVRLGERPGGRRPANRLKRVRSWLPFHRRK